ncbi:unnamed protein product [Urochloa humidicola]
MQPSTAVPASLHVLAGDGRVPHRWPTASSFLLVRAGGPAMAQLRAKRACNTGSEKAACASSGLGAMPPVPLPEECVSSVEKVVLSVEKKQAEVKQILMIFWVFSSFLLAAVFAVPVKLENMKRGLQPVEATGLKENSSENRKDIDKMRTMVDDLSKEVSGAIALATAPIRAVVPTAPVNGNVRQDPEA